MSQGRAAGVVVLALAAGAARDGDGDGRPGSGGERGVRAGRACRSSRRARSGPAAGCWGSATGSPATLTRSAQAEYASTRAGEAVLVTCRSADLARVVGFFGGGDGVVTGWASAGEPADAGRRPGAGVRHAGLRRTSTAARRRPDRVTVQGWPRTSTCWSSATATPSGSRWTGRSGATPSPRRTCASCSTRSRTPGAATPPASCSPATGPVFCAGHDFADVAARDLDGVRDLLQLCTAGDAHDRVDAPGGDRPGARDRHRGRLPARRLAATSPSPPSRRRSPCPAARAAGSATRRRSPWPATSAASGSWSWP